MQNFKDKRIFMNTEINITVRSKLGTVYTREKIDEAYGQFEYVVKNFTRFSQDSQLSLFNHDSSNPISPELFYLVDYALKLAHTTSGRFDPTIIDILEMYGYDSHKRFDNLSDKQLFNRIKSNINSRASFNEIITDRSKKTITLMNNQRIDLGSIGKGYAIRLAKEILNEFDHFLIEAGGDVYAKGSNEEGTPWKVALVTNLDNKTMLPEMCGTMKLKNKSLSSSGSWANKYRFFHHLIDTTSGLPDSKIKQVFVYGDDPLDTDAWATAIYLTGKNGFKYLKNKSLEALIIDQHDNIVTTKGFKYNSDQS